MCPVQQIKGSEPPNGWRLHAPLSVLPVQSFSFCLFVSHRAFMCCPKNWLRNLCCCCFVKRFAKKNTCFVGQSCPTHRSLYIYVQLGACQKPVTVGNNHRYFLHYQLFKCRPTKHDCTNVTSSQAPFAVCAVCRLWTKLVCHAVSMPWPIESSHTTPEAQPSIIVWKIMSCPFIFTWLAW